MNRTPGQGYPGSDFSPSLTFVPALGLSRLATSPNSIQFVWFRAYPDLSYVAASGSEDTPHGKGQWIRHRMPGLYWGIFDNDERTVKRYLASGTFESGTVSLAFDPAASPLSLYDWFVPLGQDGQFYHPQPGLAPRQRTLAYKEVIVRGSGRVAGAGTLSTAGTAVTGQGTAFLSFLRPGDILAVAGFAARVVSVATDLTLTLDAAPPVNFTGIGYAKGTDPLSYPPVAAVDDVRSASRPFVFGYDLAVASDFPNTLTGDTVQWLSASNSPAPGEAYSISYRYLPRYEITDYGSKAPVVNGQALLSVTVASLWKPQTSPDI